MTMVTIMVMNKEASMQTIQASEFKARCLALMDEVARSGEVLVVTKNGRPVAELHPYSGGRAASRPAPPSPPLPGSDSW